MMMTKPRLNPRKTPRQSRSQATYVAVLEGAARILETEGGHRLTTNHVAERAGVSVGTLYQYFPGKEAILAELIRQMRQDMLTDFEEAAREAKGKDLAFALDALIAASLRHHLRRPALAQALERVESELQLNDEIHALKARMRELIVEVLRERRIMEPERTAFDLMALSRGISDAAIQSDQRDFDDLQQRLSRAIRGYLGLAVTPLVAAPVKTSTEIAGCR
ncbi:TetR/AcrR family transcriptional regulator [Chelativorans sp. YIM 93263]|uniref:TetR/AcrR family transcriptional regulator n=1 Tax=Chelativorans sp. YIM 93263 TaxID=2906648 RepID=UPI0023793660|nr:TetR/AcrR family transcriptional regulator [Chelativorans sp. YIM 93263]